jgi:Mn-dependent DtxR family transcriptional regulator
MKQFVQRELVTIDADGHITLTEAGRQVAERTLEKHQIIAKVFMAMGVSEENALEDACKVEHDLSEETFNCIKQFYLSHIRR